MVRGSSCRKRCGFELHPGRVSEGCITVDIHNDQAIKQYNSLNELLRKEEGNNSLVVIP